MIADNVFLLIASSSACDTINHLCLKFCADAVPFEVKGLRTVFRFTLRLLAMPLAWVSIVFSLLSLFIWLYALTKAELSYAFSLDSMHHVFIAVAARLVLKENVGLQRWLGTLSIVVGIILVAASGTT